MRVLAPLLALLAAAGPAAAATPSSRGLAVQRSVVPLRAPIEGVRAESCAWTRDGARILCSFDLGAKGFQIGTLRPDGSGFRCLTCTVSLPGAPSYLYPFPDGRRFFFATLPPGASNAANGANVTPFVGECAPSIARCASTTVKAVATPAVAGGLNHREPRISPDGRRYVWTEVRTDGFLILMGDLTRSASGDYAVRGARVLTAVPAPRTAAQWSARGSFNEAKSFDGGTRLLYASTRAGGVNMDDYVLDLRTGRSTRLTRNLEWDEDAQFDPTSKYLILGSARRMHNQLRTTALAGVPSFLDAAVIVATAPASLATETMRLHTLEKWITTAKDERAGRDGEQLNDKRGGWAGSASKLPWSPDGTRAVWAERGTKGRTRLVVARFPRLARQKRLCVDRGAPGTCATPAPAWAPRLDDYPPLAPGTYRIPGPRGGTATLTYGGIVVGPSNTVAFDGFRARDGRVYDGTIEAVGIAHAASSDVTISGAARGFTRSRISGEGTTVCGTAETLLDGRRSRTQIGQWNPACTFTTPARCPDGADADATGTGGCRRDGLPSRFLAPEWRP